MRDLKRHPELSGLFPAIEDAHAQGLEEQLLKEGGPREPIKVWKGQEVIIDGHRRYAICKKHNLNCPIEEMEFSDIQAVKRWMIREQIDRRNLIPRDMSEFRARIVGDVLKHAPARETAKALKVSERTLRKDKQLQRIRESLEKDVQQAMDDLKARHKDYLEISKLPPGEQRKALEQVREGGWGALHGTPEPEPRHIDAPGRDVNHKPTRQKQPNETLLDAAEKHIGAAIRQLDSLLTQTPECDMLYRDIYGHLEHSQETIEEWRRAIQ